MNLNYFKIVFIIYFTLSDATANDGSKQQKRQAPFDELISGALQLVRPIFGSARQFATSRIDSPTEHREIPKPKSVGTPSRLSSARLRELDILGIGSREDAIAVDEMPPICQGDSRICKFIACTAHNFKRGQSFANLQMVAHLLGDRKMRRTVGMNSEAMNDACREHGMGSTQCALFTRAFRLVDKFMTTIEEGEQRSSVFRDDGDGGNGAATMENDRERGEEMTVAERKRPKPIVSATQQNVAQQISTEIPQTITTATEPTPPTTANPIGPQNDAQIKGSTEANIKGSRAWSTHHRHRGLIRSLPSSLIEGSAIEENKVVVVPNLPRKVFGAVPMNRPSAPPKAHRLVETKRTLISYRNPSSAQIDHSGPLSANENGTAILNNGIGISAAQRVVPERRNLARPLLKNTLKPMVAQKLSLIPYAHQTTTTTKLTVPTTTKTVRPKSFIPPEAEEFSDEEDEEKHANNNDNEDEAVDGADEVTTNELNQWRRRRMKNGGGSDYYDELATAASTADETDTKASRSKSNSRSIEQQNQQQYQQQQQQQMDNCLQYLG